MKLRVGCHLSSAGGFLKMGKTAASIGANTFQFFYKKSPGFQGEGAGPEISGRFWSLRKNRISGRFWPTRPTL